MALHGIFLLVAIIVIVAMIAIWAFAGSGTGSTSGHSAAGQALDDTVKEFTQEIAPPPVSTAEIDKAIAELHADNPPPPAETIAPAAAKPVAAKPVAGPPDDLLKLKGVGPKLNTMLTGLGITRFDQIAAWGPADIAAIDPQLGTFKGRIVRDNWIEQARFLAAGDIAGFEAKFGKL